MPNRSVFFGKKMSDELSESPIMKGFLFGQYANLFKMSVWWTTLAPLTFALTASPESIGYSRIVYNVALCLCSPIGGILVERVHPRKLLQGAAAARFAIWVVMIPLVWILFDTSLVSDCTMCVYILFNVAMFFDGAVVALSAILDIDLAGVDVVAGTFSLEVNDNDRNYFNTRQEFFFALCFIFLSPATAFLGLAFKHAFEKTDSQLKLAEGGTLVAIFAVVFFCATVYQWTCFRKIAPKESIDSESNLQELAVKGPDGEGVPPTLVEQVKGVPGDLLEAVKVIWSSKPILFRLIFLGLEIAFEDAAIVVIAAQMGIFLPWLGGSDAVVGNIWTSLAVACGKIGGAIASVVMMRYFSPPSEPKKFVYVFLLILISCMFIVILPVITDAHRDGKISDNFARGVFFATFFFYFFFSTLPKLGLMCLFQSMVSQVENGPRVFGFIAIIAMSFDAVVVMGLSLLFSRVDFHLALWITAYVYLAHGALELICGPVLVLLPLSRAPHEPAADVREPLPETAAPVDAPEDPGYYTQRSAVVPLAAESEPQGLTVPEEPSQVVAIMSVSKNYAFGSTLTRRVSTLAQRGGDDVAGSPGATRCLVPREEETLLSGSPRQTGSYLRKGSALLPPSRQQN